MEDVEDRAEQVRISREETPRGDKERITIERTRRVRRVIEQPKGRIPTGRGGLERMARGMIGSQESSRLEMGEEDEDEDDGPGAQDDEQEYEEDEDEDEEEESRYTGGKKGKAPASRKTTPPARHIAIAAKPTKPLASASAASAASAAKPAQKKPAAPKITTTSSSSSKTPATKTTSKKPLMMFAKKHAAGKARGVKRKRAAGGDEMTESFGVYIHRVLKEVHPEMAVSKRCVSVINSMVGDVFGRLAGEAKNLCAKADKKTLDSRDVQTATRLVLPGELAKHAVSEGTRAVVKFTGHAFK